MVSMAVNRGMMSEGHGVRQRRIVELSGVKLSQQCVVLRSHRQGTRSLNVSEEGIVENGSDRRARWTGH